MAVKRYKTLAQLKDSQLLYDKNPPAFGLWMILIVLAAVIIALVWSMFAPKTYVIKSQGTVISENRNYIMSAYTGEVVHAYVQEGDYVNKDDILFELSSDELDLQAEQISGMIQVNEEKILQYEKLEDSIKSGVNLFDENLEADKTYYYQYETYLSQIAQKDLDLSSYLNYDYTDEQIQNVVKTNESEVAEIYYSTLRSIADSIQTLQTENKSYSVQLESINNGKSAYPITANTSGIVHMDTEYKEGMVIQAASAIGNIVSDDTKYTAVVHVAANDMPLIQEGDSVEIAVSGLTQSIYGTIGGTVSHIASEATIGTENNSSTFLVQIELDSLYLISNQGNKVNLSNGMGVEARIQYDEVTYFNYMLEALGVLVR